MILEWRKIERRSILGLVSKDGAFNLIYSYKLVCMKYYEMYHLCIMSCTNIIKLYNIIKFL